MSQKPPAASPDDAPRSESRGEATPVTSNPPVSGQSQGRADAVRPRPISWHPSGPVERQLEPTRIRSIGVHSILNPPANEPAEPLGHSVGEGLIKSGKPSSRPRQASSPSIAGLGQRHSVSPAIGQRPIIAPVSPSARLVSGTGRNPQSGRISSSQSPLGTEPASGLHTAASSPPFPVHPFPGPQSHPTGTQSLTSIALHSAPSLHGRRVSVGPMTNPSPQETSPNTSQPIYQFGRSSPAFPQVSASPFSTTLPNPTMDPLTRHPAITGDPRQSGDESQASDAPHGKIPVVWDNKSGSSLQAAKRKANSDASRRFRNRKKNEVQMEQRLSVQQAEISSQANELRRQAEEVRALIEQRDFYRSERNFYREQVSRAIMAQLPVRPPSPRPIKHERESVISRQAESERSVQPRPVAPASSVPPEWSTSQPYSSGPSYSHGRFGRHDSPADFQSRFP